MAPTANQPTTLSTGMASNSHSHSLADLAMSCTGSSQHVKSTAWLPNAGVRSTTIAGPASRTAYIEYPMLQYCKDDWKLH
jgi:hypothetical protein